MEDGHRFSHTFYAAYSALTLHFTQARDALKALAATAEKYDSDGIDIYFLNNEAVGTNLKVLVLFLRWPEPPVS